MKRLAGPSVLVGVLISSFLPAALRASGGSHAPRPGGSSSSMPAPKKTPEQQAVDHYNAGLKLRDKALAFQTEEAQASGPGERTKLEKKAQQAFEKAIVQFREATAKYPRYYQAYSDLGFALRKTGDHTGALEAYDHALSLSPAYAPAIEYRGEAYLGLDRVEDAKSAYMALFGADRGQADLLLKAMKGWVEKRRAEPGSLSPDSVQEFSAWLSQREELAGQTPSVSELQQRKW